MLESIQLLASAIIHVEAGMASDEQKDLLASRNFYSFKTKRLTALGRKAKLYYETNGFICKRAARVRFLVAPGVTRAATCADAGYLKKLFSLVRHAARFEARLEADCETI